MAAELDDVPPHDAPQALRALWPLVRRFGYSDDATRRSVIERATDTDLRDLVDRVQPELSAINEYLDKTNNAERAVPFGDLAEAAIEASLKL